MILDRLDANTAGGIRDVLDAIHAISKPAGAPAAIPTPAEPIEMTSEFAEVRKDNKHLSVTVLTARLFPQAKRKREGTRPLASVRLPNPAFAHRSHYLRAGHSLDARPRDSRGCHRLWLEHNPRGDSAGLDVGDGLVDLVERPCFGITRVLPAA